MIVKQNQANKASIVPWVLLLVFTGIVAWLVLNRQFVIDTFRAAQFKPSDAIATIERDLDLTDSARQLFAASQPELKSAEPFNQSCKQNLEANNPILGCYTHQTIYVYDVTNPKLEGIEQTTAAHELLHAAYERLTVNQRELLDKELAAIYSKLKDDKLAERMEYYKKTEPGQEMNELHSILGSEFSSLGNTLEGHYGKYFRNRTTIVEFNKKYSGVFTRISDKMQQLVSQINSSTADLNQRINVHNQSIKKLQADQEVFVNKNRRGEFTDEGRFNAEQQALNRRSRVLNSERSTLTASIEEVNALRKEYDALVDEYNELSQSMNSSLAPQPSLQ